jgi:hypothetical protein
MWNVKCSAMPITIGATGIVGKGLKSGNSTRTTFNRFSTKKTYTRNITHHEESAT